MGHIERINSLLRDMPERQLPEVVDFLMLLRRRDDREIIQGIEAASLSSTHFWDNPDDEVWDHV